ncbi:MAG: PQQ-binding-like beta-propeller repeat protein [Pirellulales bacterium]
MGTAKKFIDMLEEQGLLDDDIIAELRRQIAEARTRMTPEIIAKLLVDNEQLTRFQAAKLIGKLRDSDAGSENDSPSEKGSKSSEDDLGLLPEQETRKEESTGNAAIIIDDEEDTGVVEVEPVEVEAVEVEAVEILEEVPAKSSRSRKTAKTTASASVFEQPTLAPRRNVSTAPKKNPWDSFRIWGMMGVLCLLLIPFIGLGIWIWKGSSDDLIKKADAAYESQDYETAVEKYTQFTKSFPTDEKASLAKVRVALSRIRQDTKTSSDPTRALETAKEVLPGISEEKALSGERSDLAGAMLALAEKFNLKADADRETEGKRKLIASLDAHLELLKNPQYMGATERNLYDDRIKRIEEDRARITRDIKRADDLAAALVAMRQALDAKDVTKAYNVRREVVKKHVQLDTENQLLELIKEAVTIQKSLVQSGKNQPQIQEGSEIAPSQVMTAVLANRRDGPKDKPADGILVVRAKKSIYGLQASSGAVLWRKYVGADLHHDPKRLGSDGTGDAIVSIPQLGILQKHNAETGQLIWKANFQRPINEPTIDRDELFVATQDGGIYCLDPESGQTRWSKQLPQGVDTPPGLGAGKPVLYVVGNHSNLYALSRRDGTCNEVFYLGHQQGTIKVSPVVALGHILIFDNSAPNASTIRIHKTSDNGLDIKASQLPIPLKRGHVLVSPEAEGRKIVVATDLGQIAVLEVEPAKASDQVSLLVDRNSKEEQPKLIWPLLSNNDLWVTGSNLSKLRINVAKQIIDAPWVKEDQDAFMGRAKKLDATHILHSRVVRGTMGVRFAAVEGESGDSSWEVDLGVPITWLRATSNGLPIQSISSQAALYSVDQEAMQGKKMSPVVENAGRNERSLIYANPIAMGDKATVLTNSQMNSQWAVWQEGASGGQLRRVIVGVSGAGVAADPAALGTNLIVPTSNGQLHVLDALSGQRKASPFIPTVEPGQNLGWNGPALGTDRKSVVVSDSLKRMYRIGLGPQLAKLSERDLDRPIKGRLVLLGQNIIGVGKDTATDTIDIFNEADLQTVQSMPLQGHVVWGPSVIGDSVVFMSDADGLVCMDGSGSKRWQLPLKDTSLIGEPILYEDKIVIATVSGRLLMVQQATGKLEGYLDAEEPISGTPILANGVFYIPGDEGVVLAVKASDVKSIEVQP